MANLASIMSECDSIFESSLGDRREDRGGRSVNDPFSNDEITGDEYDDRDELKEGEKSMKSRQFC